MESIAHIANILVRPRSFWVSTKEAAAMLEKSEWVIRNNYKRMNLLKKKDLSNGKKGKQNLYCLNSIYKYKMQHDSRIKNLIQL